MRPIQSTQLFVYNTRLYFKNDHELCITKTDFSGNVSINNFSNFSKTYVRRIVLWYSLSLKDHKIQAICQFFLKKSKSFLHRKIFIESVCSDA